MKYRGKRNKKKAKKHPAKHAKQSASNNGWRRKASPMSTVLSLIFMSGLFIVTFAFAFHYWQQGRYNVALWWGLGAFICFGAGIAFALHPYAVMQTRRVPTPIPDPPPVDRPSLSFQIPEEAVRGTISLHNISFPPIMKGASQFEVRIDWGNDGNSPSHIEETSIRFFVAETRPPLRVLTEKCPPRPTAQSIDVPPRIAKTQIFTSEMDNFTVAQMDDVKNLRQFFGICGYARYTTLGKPYRLDFCTFYDPNIKTYVECLREGEK